MVNAPRIAVLVPCRNEAVSISRVIDDFRAALPSATIYVYNNNSTDNTEEVACAHGAIVRRETLPGKGNVVRRMFSDVEADIYVLVDGDGTYDARYAPQMIELLLREHLDMVNGARVTEIQAAYRPGHRLGNAVLTGLVARIFGSRIHDMLSGYRVFSRRFVKSFPAASHGFEIETELTVHALQLRMPLGEVETPYRDREQGSTSKLNTYADGARILRTIILLVKDERPLLFFSLAAAVLFCLSIGLALPIVLEFHRTHLVPRFPTAILAMGIMLLSALSLFCGLILDSVARGRAEVRRMRYLDVPFFEP